MITIKEMLNCTWSGCGCGGGVDTLHSALSSTSNLLLVRCEDDFQTLPSLSSCNLLADSHGATIPGIQNCDCMTMTVSNLVLMTTRNDIIDIRKKISIVHIIVKN